MLLLVYTACRNLLQLVEGLYLYAIKEFYCGLLYASSYIPSSRNLLQIVVVVIYTPSRSLLRSVGVVYIASRSLLWSVGVIYVASRSLLIYIASRSWRRHAGVIYITSRSLRRHVGCHLYSIYRVFHLGGHLEPFFALPPQPWKLYY